MGVSLNLSVCCFTDAPAARLDRILEPLRPLGCELVIAVDARAGAQHARQVAEIADTVVRAEYVPPPERPLAWLHSLCSRDWILRIDGDEAVSTGFADALPGLVAARDITHYWVARRWLFPDGRSCLTQRPWHPDYQLRLHRNDAGLMRVPGRMHTSVVPLGPGRYIDPGLYHLALLLNSLADREAKCRAYRSQRPGLRAAGMPLNDAFYLPEKRAAVATEAVPAADTALLAGVLAAEDEPAAPADSLPPPRVVPAREVDWFWERRPVPESAYAARIALPRPELSLAAGETATVDVDATNLGDTRWPWRAEPAPEIHLGYRWLDPHGALVAEGQRTSFPAPVLPGETCRVPVSVTAPAVPGRYELEVDLVHEDVRWFGSVGRGWATVSKGTRVAVVAGYSPFRHVGDDAVVAAHVAELAEHLPEVEPILLGEQPNVLIDRFASAAEPSIHTYLTRDLTGESTGWRAATLMLARTAILLHAARRMARGRARPRPARAASPFLEQLQRVDALLACSAGALTSRYRVATLWPHAVTILAARALGKPVVLSGVGIGPFHGVLDRLVAGAAFRAAGAISVRDRHAAPRALRRLGVRSRRVVRTWDAAAKLRPAPPEAVARALDVVGIRPDAGYAVVCLQPTPEAAAAPNAVAAMVDHLAEQGIPSVFVPMVVAGAEPDQAAAAEVRARLRNRGALEVLTIIPPDDVVLGIVARSMLAIGGRYHLHLFAAASGVPGVALHYDGYTEQKICGIAELSEGMVAAVGLPAERRVLVELCARQLERGHAEPPPLPDVLPGIAALRDALPPAEPQDSSESLGASASRRDGTSSSPAGHSIPTSGSS